MGGGSIRRFKSEKYENLRSPFERFSEINDNIIIKSITKLVRTD